MIPDGDGPAGSSVPEADSIDELSRLRAENAQLRAQVEQMSSTGPPAQSRFRAVAVGVLIAVVAVTFTGATIGVWAHRSLVNTQVFVDRVTPLAKDPAVQAAVSAKVTDDLMTLVDPQALFQEALPDRARLLAVPLASVVKTFVGDQVNNFVTSDTFASLWVQVATQGHSAMLKVLHGQSDVVSASGNTIVINLVPIINRVLASIGQVSPQIFGQTIDIPTLTASDVPEVARQKIAEALGRQPSPTFGVIEIQGGGDTLSAAQSGLRIFNASVWILVVLTVLLAPLALWLSRRRRRTLLQLAFVLAIATVVVRRLVLALQSSAVAQVKVAGSRGVVEAVTRQFVNPLLNTTQIILWVLAAIALVALVTAPYPWAVSLRELLRRAVSGGAGSMTAKAHDERTVAWIRSHSGALQGVGVAVAEAVLFFFGLSWLGVLFVLVILGAYLAAVSTIARNGVLMEDRPDVLVVDRTEEGIHGRG